MKLPRAALEGIAAAEREGRAKGVRFAVAAGAGPHRFTLPWPPTVNTYWRHVGAKVLISAEGRAYRKAVFGLLAACGPLAAPVSLEIVACPPDRRKRDLDNLLKAPLDSMQHAGLYADDADVAKLTITRGPVTPGGRLLVEAATYAGTT